MSSVSLYPKITVSKNGENLPLSEVLEGIKNGRWQDIVGRYRSVVEKFGKRSPQDYQSKKQLPYYTPSGTFSVRKESGLIQHSGYICLDLDDLGEAMVRVKRQLAGDKYTYAVCESVGGNGLSMFVKVEPTEHAAIFDAVEEYYVGRYGVEVDHLADVSRPRFVSYDPGIRIDEQSKVFTLHNRVELTAQPNGTYEHTFTPDQQIEYAEEWVKKNTGLEWKEHERHKYAFRVAAMANVLGVSEHDLDAYFRAKYPHWAKCPSNAITWTYRNKAKEHGKYKSLKIRHEKPGKSHLSQEISQLSGVSLDISGEMQKIIEQGQKSQEVTFSFEPAHHEPLVFVNDTRTCSVGNIMSFISYAGWGKSQTCEAICAGFINPECDSLGFTVEIPEDKTLIYIDGERTHEDAKNGFMRIARRAELDRNPHIRDGDRLRRFHYECFIQIADRQTRILELERIIKERNPGLIIIDDITALSVDINDNREAQSLVTKIVAMANIFKFGVIATIHTNPNQKDSMKPRGHIGSEIWRVSESIFALKRAEDNTDIRRFTTDFEHAKVRNASDKVEANYIWSEDAGMFVTCDYEPSPYVKAAGKDRWEDRFGRAFIGLNSATGSAVEVVEVYISIFGGTSRTAYNHIGKAVEAGVLQITQEVPKKMLRFMPGINEKAPF